MFACVSMLCLHESAFVCCGHAVVSVYVYTRVLVLCGYYCVRVLSLSKCFSVCAVCVCVHSKIPFIQSHRLGFINRRRQHGLH